MVSNGKRMFQVNIVFLGRFFREKCIRLNTLTILGPLVRAYVNIADSHPFIGQSRDVLIVDGVALVWCDQTVCDAPLIGDKDQQELLAKPPERLEAVGIELDLLAGSDDADVLDNRTVTIQEYCFVHYYRL